MDLFKLLMNITGVTAGHPINLSELSKTYQSVRVRRLTIVACFHLQFQMILVYLTLIIIGIVCLSFVQVHMSEGG